jgi:hypothetical protein
MLGGRCAGVLQQQLLLQLRSSRLSDSVKSRRRPIWRSRSAYRMNRMLLTVRLRITTVVRN